MKYLIIYFALASAALAATGDLELKQKTASGSYRNVVIPVTNSTLLGFDAVGNIGKVNEIPLLGVGELNVIGNVVPMPPGTISMWATADIANRPTNTLVCDGNNGTASITAPTGATAIVVANTTLAAPAVTPATGTYTVAQTVTATADSGATVYYTNNSTNPDRSSSVYVAPLTASTTAEYRFVQVKNPGLLSPITTRSYTINTLSYLINDGFEEDDSAGADGSSTDGYDSPLASIDVVTGSGATINPDATGMVGGAGSESLRIINATTGNVQKRFVLESDVTSLWVKLKLRMSAVTSINRPLITLTNSAGNLSYGAGIAGSVMLGRVTNVSTYDSTHAWANGATYTVWIKFNALGACGLYATQGTTRPTDQTVATDIVIESTGTNIAVRHIVIGPAMSTVATYEIESLQVATTEIP